MTEKNKRALMISLQILALIILCLILANLNEVYLNGSGLGHVGIFVLLVVGVHAAFAIDERRFG